MKLQVQKVKSVRIFQEVVDQLQEAILSGEIPPGQVLPSELKLKEMFDTGRGTIREALRVLECRGLIEVKAGSAGGAVVLEPDAGPAARELGLLLRRQGLSMAELVSLRAGLEGLIVSLAAERMGQADHARLAEIVDRVRAHQEAGSGNWSEFVAADMAFHRELARLSGNRAHQAVLDVILGALQPLYEACEVENGNGNGIEAAMLEDLDDLQRIARALARGDATEAQRALGAHLARFSRYLPEIESEK